MPNRDKNFTHTFKSEQDIDDLMRDALINLDVDKSKLIRASLKFAVPIFLSNPTLLQLIEMNGNTQ